MKKKISCGILMCMLFCVNLSAQVFMIERGANTSLTFDNIKSAVDALQNNDRLYLPPGVHNISAYNWMGYDGNTNETGVIVVNKRVSIYGAGHSEGANTTTIKGGRFMIGKDASGSMVTGITFDGGFTLDNVSNCHIIRCRMNSYCHLDGFGNGINITECLFYGDVKSNGYNPNLEGGLASHISKCLFYPPSQHDNFYHLYDVTLTNNILLRINNAYHQFRNCSLANNIFVVDKTVTNTNVNIGYNSSNSSFSYNLWVGGYPSSDPSKNNTFTHEKERESYANVFIDEANADYHLKEACIGKNAGSDGKDVGIFGTAVPFKESRRTSIPNFTVKVISPETDASGKLPVHIVVEAQDN